MKFFLIALCSLLTVSFSESVFAGECKTSEWMPLWEGKAPGPSPKAEREKLLSPGHITQIPQPVFQVWEPREKSDKPRPALCIFPGGAYTLLAIEKEGATIARWAADHGMVGIVVKYRVSDQASDQLRFPVPLIEARRAIRTVRQNASNWGIDPGKIGVIGFSAGGHLAAMTATTWNQPVEGESGDATDRVSARPDFAMLIYPVISLDQPYGHSGTRYGILKGEKDPQKVAFCSPQRQVTKETPPLFVALSWDDGVKCQNSLDMVRAACDKGVVTELHMVTRGGHGYGMEKQGQPTDAWPVRAEEWLKAMGIIARTSDQK